MKILFIEPYPTEGPSSRYRVEQYLPYLKDNGIKCVVRPFISSLFYRIIYKKGHYFTKILFFLWSAFKRLGDIFIAINSDIVFIHLEAFPVGPPVFESLFKKLGKIIIYDLDDAIYMRSSSSANKILMYLRMPSKVKKIIKISDKVITCNEYLADFARKFNENVISIHTSVDTEKFTVSKETQRLKNDITIGWIGSHSTAPYLKCLENVLRRLSEKYRFNLRIIGAGRHDLNIPGVNIENLTWELDTEISQFQSLDIGIYPLPKNEWTLGKTGFKTIQYMSVGVPCVVSNIGANKSIVEDGVNGYLVETEDEWVERLSMLVENPALRKKIGLASRNLVEERYSLKKNAPILLEIFNNIHREKIGRYGNR